MGAKWCDIHQHHKPCEHNGGVMGETGWEAKDPCPVHGTDDDWGRPLPCQGQAGHEGKHWYILEWDDDGVI